MESRGPHAGTRRADASIAIINNNRSQKENVP
jgi:hypothetical protein